jgi:hypothetical protein
MSTSRRTFLKTSALAAAGTVLPARSWANVLGANDDIRVAVIGLNGRGMNHVSSLKRISGVRIVALCDPDTAVLERAKTRGALPDAKLYTDIRELLANKDIDAVTIATPNHWHSLAGIWAVQNGKDVYVEKPVSHNVWEGRQLVHAAKKYGKIVQAGTQIRSGEGLQEAVQWVKAGNLGKITAARGFCYKRRDSIGKCSGPQQVPASINYDITETPVMIEGEIGPAEGRRQWGLGNLLEYGSEHNPPMPHLEPALDHEEPKFIAAIEALAGGAIGG